MADVDGFEGGDAADDVPADAEREDSGDDVDADDADVDAGDADVADHDADVAAHDADVADAVSVDVGDVDADQDTDAELDGSDAGSDCPAGVANACGGCAELAVTPGDACACGSGIWACNPERLDQPWCTADGRPIYPDLDEDLHGGDAAFPAPEECDGPVPFSFLRTDCDDSDPDVFPGVYARTCPDDPAARVVCGPDARWRTEPCETGRCVEGRCDTVCEPTTERRCVAADDGDTWSVEQCDARGLGFELLEVCAAGANCIDGACVVEACDNSVDDDGDGEIDCADAYCAADPWCEPLPEDVCAAVIGIDGLRHRLSIRCLDGTVVEVSERLAGAIPQFPSWIPGTTELMFTTSTEELDGMVLRVIDVLTGATTDVPTRDLGCEYVAWPSVSPDHSALAFECVSETEMHIVTWPSLEPIFAAFLQAAPSWTHDGAGALGVVAFAPSSLTVRYFPLERFAPSTVVSPLGPHEVRPLAGADGWALDTDSFSLRWWDSPMDTAFDVLPDTVLVGRIDPIGSRALVLVRRDGAERILDHGAFVPAFAALNRFAPDALSEELSE